MHKQCTVNNNRLMPEYDGDLIRLVKIAEFM